MFTIGHLYLIFLAFGALGLLSSLIFGDVHADGDLDLHGDIGGGDADHGDHDGPKVLSLRVIFAFLLALVIVFILIFILFLPFSWVYQKNKKLFHFSLVFGLFFFILIVLFWILLAVILV